MRVKQIIVSFIVFLFFLCGSTKVYASHIYGGELLYKHLTGNSYVVTLTLYGDCGGSSFSYLRTSAPKIYIYKNASFYSTLSLNVLDSLGQEVSPVCPTMLDKTNCHIGGTLPGVTKFIYFDTVTITGASANWRFIFSGQMGPVSEAGRSNSISNAGSSVMQIEATLNNTAGANNSPQYSSIPTPFYCLEPDQQYNQGAIDADGDSLVFAIVPAISANVANPILSGSVSYVWPYTADIPLACETGKFVFSGLNGQLTFTPSVVQTSLVVCKVSEYRGGVLIGTSQREMTFIVSADCEGTPPSLKLVNITGGAATGKNVVNICEGTTNLSFGIDIANPDGDTTYITPKNVPASSVLNVNNNNTPSPSVSFSWATGSLPIGVYTFYLDVKNNHCPIANRQTIAYTINVVPFPTLAATTISTTNCIHKAGVRYDLALGYIPRYVSVFQNGAVIKTYADSTGTVMDSLAAGNYTAIVSSNPQCQTPAVSITITDSGKLPLLPITKSYCEGDVVAPFNVPTYGEGAIVTWYDGGLRMLAAPPSPPTDMAATYTWFVKQQYKVCTSDIVQVQAIVHPLPDVKIVTNPFNLCYGDTVYLEASGGAVYTWGPEDKVMYTGEQPYIRLTNPATISVLAVSKYGCKDSTAMKFAKIEACCKFGYPTAFTPNADGKNDGFNVIAFGNTYSYKLAVYNRWGQLVYLSYDPKAHWDGKFAGVACDAGTYYYFFEGTCLVGIKEARQGDITLIR